MADDPTDPPQPPDPPDDPSPDPPKPPPDILSPQGLDAWQIARNAKRRERRAASTRRELSGRQITFVALVAQGVPPLEAARQSGYTPDYNRVLLQSPKIVAAIEEAKKRLAGVRGSASTGRPVGRPRRAAAGVEPPPSLSRGPLILTPDDTPLSAARFIDGFTQKGGPLKANLATSGERDLGVQLARDLSTCLYDEMQQRWTQHNRQEAEGLMERSWSVICPPEHNPAYFLAERCWFDNVLDNPRYLYPPLHRDMFLKPVIDYILDPDPPVSGILYLGPRFTYKSTFSHGDIPMWYVLRGAHLAGFHYTVVLRHHKFELASDNLIRVKAKFLSHPWVRAVWAPACPPEGTREFGTNARFTLPWVPPGQTSDPSFRATGFGASDTGRHPDLDMGDDLVNEEHATSKLIRDDAKRRYVAKRFQLDIQTGREVNTGTPYHRMDLWSMMINSSLDGRALYRVIQIPAHLPESLGGGLAHPFKLGEKDLEKRRLEELANTGNDDFYYLQFEVTYRLDRQQTTQTWWLRDTSHSQIPEDATLVITVDPAWKGDKNYGEGDSASIQVWGIVRYGSVVHRYLIDGVHSNELSSADGEEEVFRLATKYGVRIFAPEAQTGDAFVTNMKQRAASIGWQVSIVDLKTRRVGKPDRIGAFLKEAEAAHVFICKEVEPRLLADFRSQFDNWPQVDHDDALDAAAYTCDPAILEAFAPGWGSARPNQPWARARLGLPPTRTRYTTL